MWLPSPVWLPPEFSVTRPRISTSMAGPAFCLHRCSIHPPKAAACRQSVPPYLRNSSRTAPHDKARIKREVVQTEINTYRTHHAAHPGSCPVLRVSLGRVTVRHPYPLCVSPPSTNSVKAKMFGTCHQAPPSTANAGSKYSSVNVW